MAEDTQNSDNDATALRDTIVEATKEVREARKTLAAKLLTLDLLLKKAGVVAV